jgi:hypothetical protein
MSVSEYATQSADTREDMERRWFERLRAMEPWEKLRMVGEMWRAGQELALAGLRARYPHARGARVALAAGGHVNRGQEWLSHTVLRGGTPWLLPHAFPRMRSGSRFDRYMIRALHLLDWSKKELSPRALSLILFVIHDLYG